jgi:hypothetical protein
MLMSGEIEYVPCEVHSGISHEGFWLQCPIEVIAICLGFCYVLGLALVYVEWGIVGLEGSMLCIFRVPKRSTAMACSASLLFRVSYDRCIRCRQLWLSFALGSIHENVLAVLRERTCPLQREHLVKDLHGV